MRLHSFFACALLVGLEPAAATPAQEISARSGQASAVPDDVALSERAARAMAGGRYREAAAMYERLVAARPSDAGLHMNLGVARTMAGQQRQAIDDLRQAVALDASLARAWLFLGIARLESGDPAAAVPALEKALELEPRSTQARRTLGDAMLSAGRPDAAAAQFRALLEEGDARQAPRAWYGLVLAYSELTARAFEELQRLAPDSIYAEVVRAELALAEERTAEAITTLERIAARQPDFPIARRALALAYEEAGRETEARAAHAEVTRAASDCRTTSSAICDLLADRPMAALGRVEGREDSTSLGVRVQAYDALAGEAMEKLETLPSTPELHVVRATVLQTQGRHLEAAGELREARRLAPDDPAVGRALAASLTRTRNHAEAIPLLEALIHDADDDVQLATWLGDSLLLAQRVDDAIARLERAVRGAPDFLPARASLGRAYAQTGRFADALPHLEAARGIDEDGSVHYQLARAYQSTGRTDEATRALAEYQRRQAAH
jgi:predicted Zn-dependent protease